MKATETPLPRRVHPESEATRDPIYLLQTKRHVLIGYPDWLGFDGEYFWLEDADHHQVPDWMKAHEEEDDDDDGLDQDAVENFLETFDLTGSGSCYLDHWETERVFFTRKEATEWAEARHYRWPHGWRVYCVPCEGELSAILKSQTDQEVADAGFHVLSLKWSRDAHATFYGPNSGGYAQYPDGFGVYTADEIADPMKGLDNGRETLAIPVTEVRRRISTQRFVKTEELREFIDARKERSKT